MCLPRMMMFFTLLMFLNKIDDSNSPVDHPDVKEFFGPFKGQSYEVRETSRN